jgi:hypothetical protein
VYTNLERLSQPMIRLVSNDLTRWEAPRGRCCGDDQGRLARRLAGRVAYSTGLPAADLGACYAEVSRSSGSSLRTLPS